MQENAKTDEVEVNISHTQWAIGSLRMEEKGEIFSQVRNSRGQWCAVIEDIATGRIIDVQGDADAFTYWLDNVRGR